MALSLIRGTSILRVARLALLLAVLAFPVVACGDEAPGSPQKITLGLSFIPNIQFAPFYAADALGYFEEAGVDVEFHHHAVGEDLFGGLVAGREDMMFAGGDEVIQARSRDVPLVYVAEVFTEYPVALIVPADSPIQTAADLKGRSVGIPGKYGAGYIGLLALLKSAGLAETDVDIKAIGFTQVPALLGGEVDSVVGYINNEPIQLQKAGMAVRTFPVADAQPLISNGLVALEKRLESDADLVRSVIEATLRGVEYVNGNPDGAVDLAKDYVPGLSEPDKAADALEVLKATVPLFQPNGKLGENDRQSWESMGTFLESAGFLAKPVDIDQVVSNDYLP